MSFAGNRRASFIPNSSYFTRAHPYCELQRLLKMAAKAPPWDKWIPGVLSRRQLAELLRRHDIDGSTPRFLGNCSVDLTLSDQAFRMPKGSVKPWGSKYLEGLQKDGLAEPLPPSSNGEFTLSVHHTYLFKLRENIGNLAKSGIFGQATAKSSVGRMDVLARLVVDGMDVYESFDPDAIQSGDMYVELTPMTFNVVVRPGISLVQLRFFKGRPEVSQMRGSELYRCVLADTSTRDGDLSIDLSPTAVARNEVCAFRVKPMKPNDPPLILWESASRAADPRVFWSFETAGPDERLTIERNDFYIMRSWEKIHLPRGIAVYCRATDESIGEMRIHYAGFVHPCFGQRRDKAGTPLIFEIRGHDVDVTLSHREKMARLLFYRMSEDCEDEDSKRYNKQTLKLSSFFANWPQRVTLGQDRKAVMND